MLSTKLQIGKMDRRIVIQERTETTDSYNASVVTYSTFATVWADMRDTPGNEAYESEQLVPVRLTTFIIRYLDGVTETMRIAFDDRYYDIVSITRPDRKRTLELKSMILDET